MSKPLFYKQVDLTEEQCKFLIQMLKEFTRHEGTQTITFELRFTPAMKQELVSLQYQIMKPQIIQQSIAFPKFNPLK